MATSNERLVIRSGAQLDKSDSAHARTLRFRIEFRLGSRPVRVVRERSAERAAALSPLWSAAWPHRTTHA
jgi:hypothetical protein